VLLKVDKKGLRYYISGAFKVAGASLAAIGGAAKKSGEIQK
jgi:hypothetical protein